jgi:Methyltransferase domain
MAAARRLLKRIQVWLWQLRERPASQALTVKAADAAAGGHHIRIPWHPPPASPRHRYGYGRPSHPRLAEILARDDGRYRDVLGELGAYADDLAKIPLDETDPLQPHWRNRYLFGIDGASLYGFIRARAPRLFVEIGSGNSTLFANRARVDGGLDTRIVSVDPEPRRDIDSICDRVLRQPLEEADLGIFAELTAGDVLFMDGTHRVFTNSDATVFFLDVLPELAPGVLVGIHDIHLPDDYRPEHSRRYYSEQYMLAAYLLGEASWLESALPCWYVCHHPQLEGLAHSLIPPEFAKRSPAGVIFWLTSRARS